MVQARACVAPRARLRSSMMAMLATGLCLSWGLSWASAQEAGPAAELPVYGPEAPDQKAAAMVIPAGVPDDLADIVAMALQSSPLLAASQASSESAQADLRTAKWQRFPNLTAEILSTTGGSDIADTDGIAANVALEQPVWTGGAISSAIDEARSNAEAAGSRVGVTSQNLMLDVIQTYYDTARFDGRIKVLEEGLAEYAELSAGIERRVAQQVSPAVELELARSRIAQFEADLAASEEQRDIAYLRLIELVGEGVARPQAMPFSQPPMIPPEPLAVEEMRACSPTLEERSHRLAAAQAAQDNAESQLFPRLLLQLSQNELTGARAALVLRAQTGNGLSKLSNIDRTEADVAQAMAEFAQAERQTQTVLRRQYASYRAGLKGAEVNAAAADASAALLASYQRQFVAGRRSWLDLSNAVSEVIGARLSAMQNENVAASSAALILVLTCRWQPQG